MKMEEQFPSGLEGDVQLAARSEATKLLTDAANLFGSVVREVYAQAVDSVDQAEDETAAVAYELYGRANTLAQEADRQAANYIRRVQDAAMNAYDDARMRLFAEGAFPANGISQIRQELDRGLPDDIVIGTVLEPMFARAAEVPVLDDLLPPVTPDEPARGWPVQPTNRIPPADDRASPIETTVTAPGFITPPTQFPPSTGSCPPPQVILLPPCPTAPPPPPPVDEEEDDEEVTPSEEDEEEEEEEEDEGPVSPGEDGEGEEEEGEEEEVGDEELPPLSPPPFRPAKLPLRPVAGGDPGSWASPARCFELIGPPPGTTGQAEQIVNAALKDGAQSTVASVLNLLSSVWPGGLGSNPIASAGASLTGYLDAITNWVVPTLQSGPPGSFQIAAGAMATLGAASWGEWLTGVPLSYLAQGAQYDLQYAYPQFLPSQPQVNSLRLTNTIDRNLWECLTRANGNHPWAQEAIIQSSRTRPSLDELIRLFWRGRISREDLTVFARGEGVTEATELNALIASREYIPAYTDVVRMMVRDADDPLAVQSGGLDQGFEQKYGGQLREWARAQGISDEVMRYIWRSHWQLPSPTQLYEMLHRLRQGRVPDAQAVTADLVRKTLEQNDIAPAFVERLMAVSYNTLTRTDLLQFYTNGAMGAEEIVERLQDTGYTAADAKRIVEAWTVEVANRRQNRARLWTRNNIVKAYIAGEIWRDRADQLLSRSIPDAAERQLILDDADAMRDSKRRAKCIRAVRKRRMTGELDEVQARRELVALNVDVAVAASLSEGWTCELASMTREPTVAMLSGWYTKGIIDQFEFTRRLRNIRFAPADVERIVAMVTLEENERRAKQAQQAAEKQARAAEKAAKEAERRRKEAEKRKKELEKEQSQRGQ